MKNELSRLPGSNPGEWDGCHSTGIKRVMAKNARKECTFCISIKKYMSMICCEYFVKLIRPVSVKREKTGWNVATADFGAIEMNKGDKEIEKTDV